jgi:hypothetical protein
MGISDYSKTIGGVLVSTFDFAINRPREYECWKAKYCPPVLHKSAWSKLRNLFR